MATLIDICRDAMGEVGVPPPPAIVGSTDARAVSLLALSKRTLSVVSSYKWWSELVAQGTVLTVIGQSEYALPVDFDAMVPATAYRDGLCGGLRGGLNPHNWARERAYGSLYIVPGFRLIGNTVHITPAPDTVETYSFEYKSKYRVVSAGTGAGKETFTADDDTPKISSDIIRMGVVWRYKKSRGFDYAEDYREYAEAIELAFAQQNASGILEIGRGRVENPLTDGYVRENGFGS